MVHGRGFARNEVGLAIINLTACELHLCQMTDSHGFVKTLTKMNLFRPTEVNKTNNIAGEMSPFSSLSLTHTQNTQTVGPKSHAIVYFFLFNFIRLFSFYLLFYYYRFPFFFLSSFSSCSLTGRDTHRPKGPIVAIPIDPSSL